MNTMVNKVNPYIEIGREEGRKKGREEGRAEGREEGREEAIKCAAMMLINLNVDRAICIAKLRETYRLTDGEAERFYDEALIEVEQ